jgi:hypothetical protein
LRRRIADFDDLEQRQACYRVHLRQRAPFLLAAHEAAGPARVDDRLLELEPIPCCDGGRYRVLFRRSSEDREVAVAQVEEVAVQIHPPAVAQPVEAGDLLGIFGRPLAVDLEIARAAQRRSGCARVHAHALAPAGFQSPKIGCGQSCRRDRGGARSGDPVARGKNRIGPRNLNRAGGGRGKVGKLDELGQRRIRCPGNCVNHCVFHSISRTAG